MWRPSGDAAECSSVPAEPHNRALIVQAAKAVCRHDGSDAGRDSSKRPFNHRLKQAPHPSGGIAMVDGGARPEARYFRKSHKMKDATRLTRIIVVTGT